MNNEDITKVVDEINEIVDWYRCLPMDYTGINELMYSRVQLVTLLSYFATELGNLRISWKNAEANTERVRREHTKKYLDAGFPMTKATELGKFYCIEEYTEEKMYDGYYNNAKFYYDNIVNVIDAMNQHISNLKREEQYHKKSDNLQ